MAWWRRYFLVLVLAVIFLIVQYALWFSHGGMRQHYHLQQQIQQEKVRLQQQQAQNQKLLIEVVKIKQDPELMEAHARGDLGMVKAGEEYIEVAEPIHD